MYLYNYEYLCVSNALHTFRVYIVLTQHIALRQFDISAAVVCATVNVKRCVT